MGARRASCRREPLSVSPTAASSDHLLVFPGTLPNPGICPPPRMPKPLASASPCTGLQAGLASVLPPLPCGRADIAGGCQACWGLLQGGGHGTARVGRQASVGGRGVHSLPGVQAAACKLECAHLPSLHAWLLPCRALGSCRLVAAPCLQRWPGPAGCRPLWLLELSRPLQ